MFGAVTLVMVSYFLPVGATAWAGVSMDSWTTGGWVRIGGELGGPALALAITLAGVIGAIGTFNALIDHALWFHRPVDMSDWVLSDQFSPSGIAGRGLSTSTMYNRAGQLVCLATQELYFGRAAA